MQRVSVVASLIASNPVRTTSAPRRIRTIYLPGVAGCYQVLLNGLAQESARGPLGPRRGNELDRPNAYGTSVKPIGLKDTSVPTNTLI